MSTEEAIELKAIELDDIPAILFSYNDLNKRGEYHPSTYLRLLLYYMHKNGFEKAEDKLIYLNETINN